MSPSGQNQDEPSSCSSTFHFTIRAVADPAALSRVVEYFALNNILPDTVRARHYVDGDLAIDINVRGLDDQRASVIANKLRSNVLVFSVALEVMAVGAGLQEFRLARSA